MSLNPVNKAYRSKGVSGEEWVVKNETSAKATGGTKWHFGSWVPGVLAGRRRLEKRSQGVGRMTYLSRLLKELTELP